MPETLDPFDRKILAIVQTNCQLKAEAIAEAVGLSPSAVQRRLKRLRADGLILSEIAVLDRKQLGNPMTFIAGIQIERENYDALEKFRIWADKQDNIQQVYYVTGSADLICIILARDVEEYDEITAHIMSKNPLIARIQTNVVLRTLKASLLVSIPEIEVEDRAGSIR